MDWSKGYNASYYAAILDPKTWRETGRFEILSGSVSRGTDGLRESADLLCRNFDPESETWIRVYLNARQNGSIEHTPIFTGLAVSPETNIDGNIIEHPLECYSVLQPAQDVLLQKGWYAPADFNGAEMVRRLLAVTPAPVDVRGESPALTRAIIAEKGETNLSMASKILSILDWTLRIRGNGTIEVTPRASASTATFGAAENDLIEPKINRKRDWFSCPNVVRVTQGNMTATARDDRPDSPLSTVTRGREVWKDITSPALNTGEGLAAYARRALKEAQSAGVSVSYDRRFLPELVPGDIVTLHYPRQGIEGDFRIQSQKIELGYSAKTAEEVASE